MFGSGVHQAFQAIESPEGEAKPRPLSIGPRPGFDKATWTATRLKLAAKTNTRRVAKDDIACFSALQVSA